MSLRIRGAFKGFKTKIITALGELLTTEAGETILTESSEEITLE